MRPAGTREAFFRLSTLPGEQAQVDWASFGAIAMGNTTRALSCFVMVHCWCRALFARFVLDQTLESFLRYHIAAFEAFHGVPRELLYDKLKTAVLERVGDVIRFHPRLLELARGKGPRAPRTGAIDRPLIESLLSLQVVYCDDGFTKTADCSPFGTCSNGKCVRM